MKEKFGEDEDALLIEELQSLLQEKRTALKVIRIGIALFMAQIGATGYLLTAFGRHTFAQAVYSMDFLAVLGMIILAVAIYLVVGPIFRIRRLDQEIMKIKRRHRAMAKTTN
jgi:hypothetical protein